MSRVTGELVRELIDFAPTEAAKNLGFADTQLEGTVALYNMLEQNGCAYLADEVGMGKTYVALGVMALTRYLNPSARVVVIAPRENIQRKWIKELHNFVRDNWKIVGNRVKSLQGDPAWGAVYCESLLEYLAETSLHADRDFFLRMTSFSLALKQKTARRKLRRGLRQIMPWAGSLDALSAKSAEGFRDGVGLALNAGIPDIDLVIVDEGHNLKHGFGDGRQVSTRNRIMGLAFGHPSVDTTGLEWYGRRAKRVLLLSATPFEEDYAAIQKQFDVMGHGDAVLRDGHGKSARSMADLADPSLSDAAKREIVGNLMVRRVSALRIAGQRYTKNMYRREWRQGGYATHDDPMQITDTRQRLVVALMQKKLAEVLQDTRFNNHFQIGMLSSFESFIESVGTAERRRKRVTVDVAPGELPEESEEDEPVFDGHQVATRDERQGIDTEAIAQIVQSYRERFGSGLPHPKLDASADSLRSAFETGEKTLVFVRRVATVRELAAKLDAAFDAWMRDRMERALPSLRAEIATLFERYRMERKDRPDDQFEGFKVDEAEEEADDLAEDRLFGEDQDPGSAETFFAWFFRGGERTGLLSGAAFQKNRLASTSSAYATLFEDDYVTWLLGDPADPVDALAEAVGLPGSWLTPELRRQAYARYRQRTRRAKGYPRVHVMEAYQIVGLERLAAAGGEIGERARVVLEERGWASPQVEAEAPGGFPGPEDGIGAVTFFTELRNRPALRDRIWPASSVEDFRARFRDREQRRELISALSRLGAAYIDLYLLAIGELGSFDLRGEGSGEDLARGYCELLEGQMRAASGFNALYELSHAADAFDQLLAVNFHDVPGAPLGEIASIYGATLQRQVPVGRMSGGVNKRLVRQFRMPGFPLVLITTDVLQEGEDLHTFCRRVVHYGITWTPSAMEQRTGRVDRIGSLVQRRLDGSASVPSPDELIQVFYPHLRDTVEVLQVRRVLARLNRFLRLIHRGDLGEGDESRIDAAREMLEELTDVPPLEGLLESAFPVRAAWLEGDGSAVDVVSADVAALERHLEEMWSGVKGVLAVREAGVGVGLRARQGSVLVSDGRVLGSDDGVDDAIGQPVRLELRSQTAGDATLLRCISEVGRLDLRDDALLDRLYDQQFELGMIKLCVHPDARWHEDLVTVEGGVLFSPETTQIEEVQGLVSRCAGAAAALRASLGLDALAEEV